MKLNNRTQRTWIKIAAIVSAVNILVSPVASLAATKNWDGGGADVNWNTAANWDGPDALPANDFSGTGDVATFNQGSYTRQPTMNVAWGILGLSFGASSGAITITAGNTLTIGGSGIVVASGGPAHTINNAIKLGASQNWDNNDDSLLTVGGTISNTGNTAPYTLTFGGNSSGGITLSGIISDGGTTGTIALRVNTTSTGITTLSSANSTFTGGTKLSGGTISINASSTPTIGPFYTGGSGPLGTGTFTIDGASTIKTSGAFTIANDLAINAGAVTINITPTTSLTINGVNQSIAGGPTLNFTAATTTFSYYAMNVNSDVTLQGAGTVAFSGGLTVDGAAGTRTITDSLSTALTISGPLTLNKSLTFTGNHGAVALTVTPSITIVPWVDGSSPRTLTFTDTGAGATTFGVATAGTSILVLNESLSLQRTGTKTVNTIINGIRVPATRTPTLSLDNQTGSGTITFGTGAGKEIFLHGNLALSFTTPATAQTIGNTFVGTGNFTLNNGTVTLSGGGGNLYTGTITVGSGGNVTTLKPSGANTLPTIADYVLADTAGTVQKIDLSNLGDVQIGSLASASVDGTVTSTGGVRTLNVGNATSPTFAGSLGANVNLTKTGSGTMTLSNANSAYTGTTTVRRGGLTISGAGTITGGNVVVDSGLLTLDNSGGTFISRLGDAKTISLGSLTLTSYNGAGAQTETTGVATFNAPGKVTINNGSTAGDRTTLAFTGTMVRSTGAAVDFVGTNGTLGGGANAPNVTNSAAWAGAQNNILPWATVGGTQWAEDNAFSLRAYSGGFQTLATATSTTQAQQTGAASPGGSAIATSSLNVIANGSSNILDLGNNVVSFGNTTTTLVAILKSGTNPYTISASGTGSLQGGTGGLGTEAIIHVDGGDLTISAPLTQLNTANAYLTKGGSGKLILTGSHVATWIGVGIAGTLELGGSTNFAISGPINGPGTLVINMANDSGLVSIGGGANVSTFSGGTELKKGTLSLEQTSVPAFVGQALYGILGSGPLTITGNNVTITAGGTASAANDVIINPTVAGSTINFGDTTNAKRLDLYGPNPSIANNPVINVVQTDPTYGYNFYGTMTFKSGATFQSNYVAAARILGLLGGLRLDTANPTLTFNAGPSYTLDGPLSSTTANNTLTLAGTGNITIKNLLSGLNEPKLIVDGSGTYTFASGVAQASYGGGTRIKQGTVVIGEDNGGRDSTGTLATDPAPGVVYGPFGTGTLTLEGGTLVQPGTNRNRIIHNTLVINGNVTLGGLGKTTSITFCGASQTIVAGSTITVLSPVTFGIGLTTTGNVTFGGPGAITLLRQVTDTNPVTIGNNTTFSGNGVGGSVSVGSQVALGTGVVTINYGGTLTLSNVVYSNTMAVNAGGTINLGGNTNTGLNITVNSMGTIGTGSTAFGGTLPTAGVLFNNGTTTATKAGGIILSGNTLTIGGTGALTVTPPSSAAGLTVNSASTIAFNASAVTTFSGTTSTALNANLTVAGSGNTGLTGMVPTRAAGNLGAVTGNSNIINVNMAPTGAVQASDNSGSGSTGYTLNVNRGTFIAGTGLTTLVSRKVFGGSTVKINGGVVRASTSTLTWPATVMDDFEIGATGGAIEAYAMNNDPAFKFGGSITKAAGGAGPLTLRVEGDAGKSNRLVLSGDNAGFDSGFTLAQIYGLGAFRFDSSAAMGSTANVITAPAGIMFGFGSNELFTAANLNRFSADTQSILALDNKTGNIDLSNADGGLDQDVRLGHMGMAGDSVSLSLTYAGTITPYNATVGYKLTPGVGGTLTLSGNNALSGDNPVDISTGAVVAGANDVVRGTLVITAAQSYSGSTTVQGTVKNALMGGGVGAPTLRLGYSTGNWGNLSNTSSIIIDKNAILVVGGGDQTNGTSSWWGRITSANVPITVRGGATLQVGEDASFNYNNQLTDQITNSAVLTLGGTNGGGTFKMGGAGNVFYHYQTLASLSIGAGLNSIVRGTSETPTDGVRITFTGAGGAGYTRSAGGLVDYTTPTSASYSAKFSTTPTGTSVIGGILVGAIYDAAVTTGMIAANNTKWAEPTYTTDNSPNNWVTGENVVTSAAYSGTLTANRFVNSVKSITGGGTINLGTNILTIESGMFLHGAGTAMTIQGSAGTPTDGELRTANGQDLVLYARQTAITINSKIGQEGGTTTRALTKGGASTVTLANANNQISDIYVNAGTLTASGGLNRLGATDNARTWHLLGGGITVDTGGGANGTAANVSLDVGPQGGLIAFDTSTDATTLTIGSSGKTITLNGVLGTRSYTGTGTREIILAGDITGAGTIYLGAGNSATKKNVTTLSGANSSWTGGVFVNTTVPTGPFGGTASGNNVLRVASANALGSGPISLASASSYSVGITFTSGAGTSSYANDFVLNTASYIQNTKTNGAVTLSGRIIGTTGLVFQGYDNSGSVSETVLSGTLSMSGVPVAGVAGSYYSYGNASTVQNFVNGQAGINLGATAYVGTSLLAANDHRSLLAPDSLSVAVTAGAEGYVRFSGTQSLIPGAVGPGYVAAIRKGNASSDTKAFGYLLTPQTTAYQLPEGKSFVIGVLGTGGDNTVTGGTFGAKGATGTATFNGNDKLAGAPAGDINIHGNAAADNATLNLFADTNATLTLGTSKAVVFTPTYGDSGATSTITLMRDRTGTTTLNKTGAGTLQWNNASLKKLDNVTAIAANQVTVYVKEGTLAGTGTIVGAVNVNAGGTLAPGTGLGTETLTATSVTFANDATAKLQVGLTSTTSDKLSVSGTATLTGATLTASFIGSGSLTSSYTVLTATGGRTGTFTNTKVTVNGEDLNIVYDGNDVKLEKSSAGTLILFK